MFKNFFRIKPKTFLGIDIGSSFLKIVELGRQSKKLVLKNYAELRIPHPEEKSFRTFEKNTLLLSDQEIARTIETILKEAKIKTKEVNFSIPDFSSFFTSINLPIMSKEEVEEAIRFEVRPYIPLPLSEITLDWVITEGDLGKTALKVLVVAIPNDVINQYKEIARVSKLELKSLEPEVFAIVRGLKDSIVKKEKKEVIALIDIGARSTTYNILEQGMLKVSHSFNIGSNELTGTLVKSLDIGYNEAEELKREKGLSTETLKFNSHRSIREILLPLIDAMVNEAKKIFRNFYQTEGKEVNKIILAGGLALLPGLKEYFGKELQKEIVIANPFLNISYPAVLKETLEKAGPSYAVAVGLAAKGFE